MPSAIGLDIGSSAVRAVQLSRKRGTVSVERIGQVILAPGTVVAGRIEDSAGLVQALVILWAQFGFTSRKVAMGLANQEVIVRRVDLPLIPQEGFAESLRLQAEDHLPLPMDEVEFDYEFIEEYEGEEGAAMMRVLLVAASSGMVRHLVDVARAAKLRPVLLDLDAFAQIRSLSDPTASVDRFGPGSGEMVVNIGADLTTIVVHTNGTPRFVRMIPLAGYHITESLASAFGMSWEQAETIKSVAPGSGSPYAELLAERAQGLVSEIRSSVDYYRAQPGSVAIESVILTGGTSLMPGLDVRLAEGMRVDVVRGQSFRRTSIGDVPMSPGDLDAASPFFAVAVGLALQAVAG